MENHRLIPSQWEAFSPSSGGIRTLNRGYPCEEANVLVAGVRRTHVILSVVGKGCCLQKGFS